MAKLLLLLGDGSQSTPPVLTLSRPSGLSSARTGISISSLPTGTACSMRSFTSCFAMREACHEFRLQTRSERVGWAMVRGIRFGDAIPAAQQRQRRDHDSAASDTAALVTPN